MELIRVTEHTRETFDCRIYNYIYLLKLDDSLYLVSNVTRITGYTNRTDTADSVFTDYSDATAYFDKLMKETKQQ